MDVSEDLLFVASPLSGDVSILSIATRKVIAVWRWGAIPVYPRHGERSVCAGAQSEVGGRAILSVPAINKKKNRYKTAALLTVIRVAPDQ
jgi:hypothetical protein